jgi:DNA uptake protein ComE-like DNA-binding protein
MTRAIGEAKSVNLNSASPEELDRVGGLGQERARRIVGSRPFPSWDDLKQAGATL